MPELRNEWRAIGWQVFGSTLLMFALYWLSRPISVENIPFGEQLLTLLLVAWPVLLWLYFSFMRNQGSANPTSGLLLVFVLCFLAARALVLPLVEQWLQPDLWLPGAQTITRLLGFSLVIGFTQECTRYFVIRYTMWGSGIRSRKDVVAYGTAGAVSCALAVNLDWLFATEVEVPAVALAILETQLLHFTGAMTLALGMSEVRLGQANPFLLAFATLSASLQVGILISARAGLANTSFSLPTSDASLWIGAVWIVIGALSFLSINAILFLRADRSPIHLAENRTIAV
ncbi:MAG: hypothetical protein OXF22_01330 [Anaerolineaceae bacterium]|nr:hypothetical protein [Anaerolineaceae bacterium]